LRIERVGRRWTMPMAKIFKITRAGSLAERLRDPFANRRTGSRCLS
jgi:hypothetical protein